MVGITHVTAEVGPRERIHVQAGNHVLVLDQPEENRGDGLGPTPVDLFVASVAACSAHYLRLACRRHGIDPAGLAVEATAEPALIGPSRIGSISVACFLPAAVPAQLQQRLMRTAEACYVARTIQGAPDIRLELTCGTTLAV